MPEQICEKAKNNFCLILFIQLLILNAAALIKMFIASPEVPLRYDKFKSLFDKLRVNDIFSIIQLH